MFFAASFLINISSCKVVFVGLITQPRSIVRCQEQL
jgi:hypothetical protein